LEGVEGSSRDRKRKKNKNTIAVWECTYQGRIAGSHREQKPLVRFTGQFWIAEDVPRSWYDQV